MTYEPKTDEQIKQLAVDTFNEKIFWATMIQHDPRMLSMVFMPLGFMEEKDILELKEHNAVPYEYMDKAGPRSVNGYPSFFSCHWINFKDYERVIEKLEEIKAAVEAVK